MNILYDHQCFAMQKYGGISRVFFEIASRIAQKENVYLYEGYHINEYGLEKAEGINVLKAVKKPCIPKTGRLFHFLNKQGLCRQVKSDKYDIYHPTYYEDYACGRSRLILTVHDMIHELFPAYFPDFTVEVARKENLIKKADRIIAISMATKKDLMNIYNVPEEKIDIVYHGNSLRLPVHELPLVSSPYVLFVGTRFIYKNFVRMLKAWATSKFCHDLQIVAFGGGIFSKSEMLLIKDLGLERQVMQMTGDDCMLANLYKYAEAFIYPSEYEGFGLPLLEAMHYGTPVLCSNTSSLPEVAGEAACYFAPEEIDDMREKIDKVLGDGSLRKDLSCKGIAREKKFSWDKCAEETLAVYRRALQ